MNIEVLIEKLPALLVYLIPGYIGITVFRLLMALKLNATTIWVNSAVLSFVSMAFLQWKFPQLLSIWNLCVVSILLCSIGGIVMAAICRHPKLDQVLRSKFGIGVFDSVIQDTIDYQNGSAAVITLKNDPGEYRGYVIAVSDATSVQQWISIANPCYFDHQGQLVWERPDQQGLTSKMVFPLNEIKSIVIVSETTH